MYEINSHNTIKERCKMNTTPILSLCLLLLLSGCYDNKKVSKKTVQTSPSSNETKANNKIVFLEDDKTYKNFAIIRFHEDVSPEKIKPFLNEMGVRLLKNNFDAKLNQWGVKIIQQELYKIPGHELRNVLMPLSKSNMVRYIVVRAPLADVAGSVSGEAIAVLNYDAYTNHEKVKLIEPFLESKGVYLITILSGIVVRYDESIWSFPQLAKELSTHPEINNVRPETAGGIKPLE